MCMNVGSPMYMFMSAQTNIVNQYIYVYTCVRIHADMYFHMRMCKSILAYKYTDISNYIHMCIYGYITRARFAGIASQLARIISTLFVANCGIVTRIGRLHHLPARVRAAKTKGLTRSRKPTLSSRKRSSTAPPVAHLQLPPVRQVGAGLCTGARRACAGPAPPARCGPAPFSADARG